MSSVYVQDNNALVQQQNTKQLVKLLSTISLITFVYIVNLDMPTQSFSIHWDIAFMACMQFNLFNCSFLCCYSYIFGFCLGYVVFIFSSVVLVYIAFSMGEQNLSKTKNLNRGIWIQLGLFCSPAVLWKFGSIIFSVPTIFSLQFFSNYSNSFILLLVIVFLSAYLYIDLFCLNFDVLT